MNTLETWALHAYADGELDAAERVAIEKMLAEDPAARAALETLKHQKEALKAAYGAIADEPVPASLAASLRYRGGSGALPYAAMAAGLALLLAGGAGGWLAARQTFTEASFSLADRAIVAHQVYAAEVRHPVEVMASEKDHLQTWLSKRIGNQFRIPDLVPQGYTLLGGRLLAAQDRPAAQLMYEDTAKRRITIFLTAYPGNGETAFRVEQKGDLVACYWLDGQLGFVIAGEMDRTRMMLLAQVVYDQFEG